MLSLATWSWIIAGALALSGVAAVANPSGLRGALGRFPRNVAAGRILAGAALVWVAILVWHFPLGGFDAYKPALWALAPAAYYLTITFADELLAPRALGGLLLLLAGPVLAVARFHPSAWRLAVVLLAYAWIVAGMALVLSPWLFRKIMVERINATDRRCRRAGIARLAAGLGLAFLAWRVF